MSTKEIQVTIVDRFLNYFQNEQNVYRVVKELARQTAGSANLFACGGMIRDAVISVITGESIESVDFDFVCEGLTEEQFESCLTTLQGNCEEIEKIIHAGKSFPVWKIKVCGVSDPMDFALARTESSFGSHHREFHVKTQGVTIFDDSRRRDFTINALYIRLFVDQQLHLSGDLIDHHNGLADIISRTITCVGVPKERLVEDPLRILRAVRFCARFQGFSISESTAESIRDLAEDLIPTISRERISDELLKMLKTHPEQALVDLERLGVLKEIIPHLSPLNEQIVMRVGSRIDYLKKCSEIAAKPNVFFCALLYDLAEQELAQKMVDSMSSARLPVQFFTTETVQTIARELRIPGAKDIARLCDDTLILLHYAFLQTGDAVVEEIYQSHAHPEILTSFLKAQARTINLVGSAAAEKPDLSKTLIDFNRLLAASGIPRGPHLRDLKLRLRQAEIDGDIYDDATARAHINRFYLEDTHVLKEHVAKLKSVFHDSRQDKLPASLRDEIRWLLFNKPGRVISVYKENDLLKRVFPELDEAEQHVEMTRHHFAQSFINDVLLAISILYDERPSPTAVQILSLLFLDIGMARTRGTNKKGEPTYYNHDRVGAEMAVRICARLGIESTIASDVFFIIQNHNTLIMSGGPNRFRKLVGIVDDCLLDDLLLVHQVDQLAKAKIQSGSRKTGNLLDHYEVIAKNRDNWLEEERKRAELVKVKRKRPFVNGRELQGNSELWGAGVPSGPELGSIKRNLDQLQYKGIIENKEGALLAARNHIVLYHLTQNPAEYLELLRTRGLLKSVLPEVAALIDLDQSSRYHQQHD